ncbi:response regulator [Nostoc sp. LEGE 12450]|uniref:response regulator n=1 Tax=Nostoc sp. LEGE 12450 TaxID=1828643 RepID=UPI0018829388|nr:response regulator [Nostoc sp. LEGE 12450]MBE8987452.1 response regulator [Nostoc sp. LEGE 12450]
MSDNFFDLHLEDDIDIFKGLTILAVDDTNDILILISYIFESYGIHVMTASSATAAFEIIKQFPVDLLISDIAMPEKSGYWLIQKVRTLTHPQKREIPAIAFTGSVEDNSSEKALAFGFHIYLQKSSTPKLLITEVVKLLLGVVLRKPTSSLENRG